MKIQRDRLITIIERAMAGKTEPIPHDLMRLSNEPTEPKSRVAGSFQDDSQIRSLFFELQHLNNELRQLAIEGKAKANKGDMQESLEMLEEYSNAKESVLEPLLAVMWSAIYRKFPELNGMSLEILSGLRVSGSPPKQMPMIAIVGH